MTTAPTPSELLADAALKVARFRGRPVVVKLGGSAMEDPVATRCSLRSVATLNLLGVPVVLIHGGGKPIDRAMADAGLTSKKVAGRRYTDEATLAVVVTVLHRINEGLADQLDQLGCPADGFNDVSNDPSEHPLRGEVLTLTGADGRPIDLGLVGRPTRVLVSRIEDVLSGGYIPVIPSLAWREGGGWLNVNADTAASAVAGALAVDRAIFLTDTPGVLRDRSEPGSLIPKLTEAECRGLIASRVIDGGMVPKVEACFEALAAGAKSALILDGRVPYSLLDVFVSDRFTGTEITR